MADISEKMEAVKIGTGAVFAEKKAAGKRGIPTNVVSNLAKIDLAKNQPFFKYDVEIYATIVKKDGSTLEKEVTRPSRQDTTGQIRKAAAVTVFKKVISETGKFFDNNNTFYDRAKVLFSLKKLDLTSQKVFNTTIANVDGFEDAVSFSFKIKPCAESFQTSTNDLAKVVNSRPDLQDKTLMEALNLVFSQGPFMDNQNYISYGQGTHFLMDPEKFGFRNNDLPVLPDGKYMGVAVCKKVSVLEGDGREPTAYLSTEIKKTSFHADYMPLFDKICSYGFLRGYTSVQDLNRNIKNYKQVLKGLMVCPVYNTKMFFPIHSVTEQTAAQSTFVHDGNKTTVLSYMRNVKKIEVKHSDLFMVTVLQKGKLNQYPVESLLVAPSQRVIQSQSTREENEIAIRASATVPKIRLAQTETMKKALGFTAENSKLIGAGIKVANELSTVPARVLDGPTIVYGNKKMVKTLDNCKWKGETLPYLSPAKLTKWILVVNISAQDEKKGIKFQQFADVLVRQMADRGMNVNKPVLQAIRPSVAEIESTLAKAKDQQMELVMFVSSDNVKLHDDIKRLECKYQVLTQEVKLTNVAKMLAPRGLPQTLENVINKTNEKLGGINFQVLVGAEANTQKWILDNNRMFFGLEMSHPAPMSKAELEKGGYSHPSVLGYSANTDRHPQQYIGDYFYVEPRSTEPMGEMIEKIVPKALREAKANRNAAPNHLVFFIHGVSEGQYSEIATTYRDYIRKGLDTLSKEYKPLLTIIAMTKEHNERFYAKPIVGEKAAQQNIKPGTIVDRVVVNPAVNEFYLTSHSAFQGTAKTPKYTIVYDTSGAPADVHQGMTHGLCFLHQIINASVSVPVPLIVADRCAKRGNKNFASLNNTTNVSLDIPQLNADMTNNGKRLNRFRYNA